MRAYRTQAQQNAYFDEVLRLARERAGRQGGRTHGCAAAGPQPQLGARRRRGRRIRTGNIPTAFVRIVSDGYIGAMGIPLRSRPRLHGARHAVERTGDRDQRNHGAHAVAGRGCAGQDHARPAESGAWWAWWATCGIWRWSRARATRCTCPSASASDFASVDLVVRTTLPPAELAAARARRAQTDRAQPAGQRFPPLAATGG